MGRKMVKPRFYVESQIWKKTPLYLVSGTTIQHYIVPSFKEQLFFYKNPVLDLFCRVGWTKQYFLGSSSWTNFKNTSIRFYKYQ